MFESRCPDCRTTVAFPELPRDATCGACGLRLYVTDNQAVGRYPTPTGHQAGSKAGGSRESDFTHAEL
jgi:hypothetical protein